MGPIADVTRPLVALAAIATIAACAPREPAADTSSDVAELKAMQDRELAAVSSGNIDSILAVYTADVVLMPPGEPARMGSDGVRQWLEQAFKSFSISGRYDPADVEVAGDWAIVRYTGDMTITPKGAGQPMTERIKGIHVFRRQSDGTWKIAQDVWNTDAPAPAPST